MTTAQRLTLARETWFYCSPHEPQPSRWCTDVDPCKLHAAIAALIERVEREMVERAASVADAWKKLDRVDAPWAIAQEIRALVERP